MNSTAIVTRNAIHGGVETMVAMHQALFDASVYVAGGINHPSTCPFRYTYIDATEPAAAHARLTHLLRKHDVIIYHWLPSWAQESVRLADKPCIEVVHREDTADNDKTIPDVVLTHSRYLADYLRRESSREAEVIPHAVDIERFAPTTAGLCVGAITSYYPSKGIDLLLLAWAQIEAQFPQHALRLYGAGSDRGVLEAMAQRLGLQRAEVLGSVAEPAIHYPEFCLFVQPSRAEGMPFAIVEALACNIPVVASDLPAMVEFNQDAERRGYAAPLVLFPSEDPTALARTIADCLSDVHGQVRSREYVQTFYGPDQHRARYALAIQRAIAVHTERVAHDRDWHGWRRPPQEIARNLYHVAVPRRLRLTMWARRHPHVAPR